jgi:hypothetical protein
VAPYQDPEKRPELGWPAGSSYGPLFVPKFPRRPLLSSSVNRGNLPLAFLVLTQTILPEKHVYKYDRKQQREERRCGGVVRHTIVLFVLIALIAAMTALPAFAGVIVSD